MLADVGKNNVEKIKAVSYTYIIDDKLHDWEEDTYRGFEDNLHERFDRWKKNLRHCDVHLFTVQGFVVAIIEDINNDFGLVFGAIIMVATYTFMFLGNFSPMHCRCLVTLAGLICVAFSYLAGFGLMYLLGGETTGVH